MLHSFEEITNSGAPVTLVECIGDLTGDSLSRLFDHLLLQLDYGLRHVLLDLTGVDAADDAIALVAAGVDYRARSTNCTLSLISPSPEALARLDLAGINQALVIHPDLEEALAQLEVGPS